MSKKCPKIVQIDNDTHKKLKLWSAEKNMTMGDIVKAMAISMTIIEKECDSIREGVTQND